MSVSPAFIKFFDEQDQRRRLYVSSVSFWEIALLVQKGRLAITNVEVWKDILLQRTNLNLLNPTATEMIASTLLPPYHKDPFDRLLIMQTKQQGLILVTQDEIIPKYDVATHWIP